MRVWTRQVPQVWEEIQTTGRYLVREEYVRAKNLEISDYYIGLYRWLTEMLRSRIDMPADAKFPVWLALTEEQRLPLAPNTISLTLNIPDEHLYLLEISRFELVESNGTSRRIVSILAHRQHLTGGAHITQHKDLVVPGFGSSLSSQSHSCTIHCLNLLIEVIVVLRNALRRESIGGNNISTGSHIAPMYIEDRLRIGKREMIIVAFHQQRTHRSVQKKNSIVKSLP
jgi:hypothetical protein